MLSLLVIAFAVVGGAFVTINTMLSSESESNDSERNNEKDEKVEITSKNHVSESNDSISDDDTITNEIKVPDVNKSTVDVSETKVDLDPVRITTPALFQGFVNHCGNNKIILREYMIIAIRLGNVFLLRSIILENLINVSEVVPTPTNQYIAPAFVAVLSRMSECLKTLIVDGKVDPNQINSNKENYVIDKVLSLLQVAIMQDNVEAVKVLLDNGANANLVVGGLSPLHMAVNYQRVGCVKALVNAGGDLNLKSAAKEISGYTPLELAVKYLNVEIVKVMVDDGRVDAVVHKHLFLDLCNAKEIETKHTELLKLLLQTKLNPNERSNCYMRMPRYMPGFVSTTSNQVDVGSDGIACSFDDLGWTPIHFAVWFGHIALVKLLLNHGVDVNSLCHLHRYADYDHSIGTPLHLGLLRHQDDLELVRLLLESGALIKTPTATYQPIHLANSAKTLELLLQYGADVNEVDLTDEELLEDELGCQYTPLHLAAAAYPSMVPLLLDKGAYINALDAFGRTPLHRAVAHNLFSSIEYLLLKGADAGILARKFATWDETPVTPLGVVNKMGFFSLRPYLLAALLTQYSHLGLIFEIHKSRTHVKDEREKVFSFMEKLFEQQNDTLNQDSSYIIKLTRRRICDLFGTEGSEVNQCFLKMLKNLKEKDTKLLQIICNRIQIKNPPISNRDILFNILKRIGRDAVKTLCHVVFLGNSNNNNRKDNYQDNGGDGVILNNNDNDNDNNNDDDEDNDK